MMIPQSMRMVVDLPEPLGPRNPNISPFFTEKDILLTATKWPKRFSRSLTRMTSSFEGIMNQLLIDRRMRAIMASSRLVKSDRISAGGAWSSNCARCISPMLSHFSPSSRYAVETQDGHAVQFHLVQNIPELCRETGSTPLVGSSRISNCGSCTRTQASPSFCFMPPDRFPA